ncbi:MAG TPA: ABC transporter permease [Puia sp.]|nr:ABC transporter permease [Puia sp.]
MLRNYWKTAIRALSRNKTLGAINILGLTLGSVCCLYIVLYVSDQWRYDRQHRRYTDIYRIDHEVTGQGGSARVATTVAPVAPLMKHDFPEVDQYTRVFPMLGVEDQLLHYKDKTLYEKDVVYADSTFFDVFRFHFDGGDAATALKEPYSVVLLQSVASRLFGGEDPIGKTITLENIYFKKDYVVRGVIDESLGPSHLHAGVFLTMNSGFLGDEALHTDAWTRNGYVSSYVRLKTGADPAALERKLPDFVARYGGPQLKPTGVSDRLYLQPVTSIHLTTGLGGPQLTDPVSPVFLDILLSIAILIQLIACINFMNLSTARATKRAKEVAVRKVIGAEKGQLVGQFLTESMLLTGLALLLAIPLLVIALPWLNSITGADIRWSVILRDGNTWTILAGVMLGTGLVAGSYPAFYLSAFKAINVIKGNYTNGISAVSLRRTLVVFQFVLSIVLIMGICVIYSQLNYIRNKDLGFDPNQRLVFSFETNAAMDHIPVFMNDLRSLAGIRVVSDASSYLSAPSFFSNTFWLKGQREDQGKGANFLIADENFVRAYGVRLVSGRDLLPTDSAKVLINETFARQLGLDPHHAAGTLLDDSQNRIEEIVGVMQDFNYNKLDKAPEGFLVWKNKQRVDDWAHVVASASTADYGRLLAGVSAIWAKDVPGVPLTYSFMDEAVQRQYAAEISLSHIIRAFTIMAIFISCLGLFGLSAFSAEQRKKEFSIRKVLGAGVPGLARLLAMEFLRLVFLAFFIAAPLSGWIMDRWLREFAYRVSLQWWMCALSGLLAVSIALITVGYQAMRAALANPINSLRSE